MRAADSTDSVNLFSVCESPGWGSNANSSDALWPGRSQLPLCTHHTFAVMQTVLLINLQLCIVNGITLEFTAWGYSVLKCIAINTKLTARSFLIVWEKSSGPT